jgi:hypothetical protein
LSVAARAITAPGESANWQGATWVQSGVLCHAFDESLSPALGFLGLDDAVSIGIHALEHPSAEVTATTKSTAVSPAATPVASSAAVTSPLGVGGTNSDQKNDKHESNG